jgi:hypothetical protein
MAIGPEPCNKELAGKSSIPGARCRETYVDRENLGGSHAPGWTPLIPEGCSALCVSGMLSGTDPFIVFF